MPQNQLISRSSGSGLGVERRSVGSNRLSEGWIMLVRIRKVEPLDSRRVRLEFTDGESREMDLAPLLKGPVFRQVRKEDAYFRKVRVNDVTGTIEWPNGADLDPDVLYDESLEPA